MNKKKLSELLRNEYKEAHQLGEFMIEEGRFVKTRSVHSQKEIKSSFPMKLPLALTIGRIFVSPVFLALYLNYQHLGISLYALPFVLLLLLGLSELSDFFDGYLARKFNGVTQLGKVLDPMADSITRLTILLTFTQGIINLPLLLVFVFIYRDAMISTLRTICALKGVTLAARTSGKIKACLQALSILLILVLMIPYAWGVLSLAGLQKMSLLIILAAAFYTIYSGAEYTYSNRAYIKQAWEK